jgi:xylulokinase
MFISPAAELDGKVLRPSPWKEACPIQEREVERLLSGRYSIGIDLGTTGIKILVLGDNGMIHGSVFESYPLLNPKSAWAEQNPHDWTDKAVEGITTALSLSHAKPDDIRGIGVASQIDGVVPVGENGEPLRNAIIWMDRRAKRQCDEIRTLVSTEKMYSVTGLSIDPSHVAPKIMWIRDNEPEAYSRTARFLLPGNYLVYFLTGEAITDHSNASCTLLYDIGKGDWSNELCDALHIPQEKLPVISNSTHTAGNLRAPIAKLCGLNENVKVSIGGGDEEMGAVGAGVIDHGALLDLTGTSEPMCLCLDKPSMDPTGLLECHAHAYPGKWLLENTGGLAGGVFRWFRDELAATDSQEAEKLGTETYEMLNREISKIPAGSDGLLFLPFFSGAILPEWNPDARGVFMGLTLKHTRAHMGRSILEGTAYVLRDMVLHLSKIGLEPSRIVLAGGGARSLVWRQIKADVVNRTMTCCENGEVTALGAAMISAVGCGLYDSIDEAVGKTVTLSEDLRPSPASSEIYRKLHAIYSEAYEALKPVFQKTAEFQES